MKVLPKLVANVCVRGGVSKECQLPGKKPTQVDSYRLSLSAKLNSSGRSFSTASPIAAVRGLKNRSLGGGLVVRARNKGKW